MPNWLMAVDHLYEIIGYAATVVLCLFAFFLGSIRERLVALVIALDGVTISAFDIYLDGWPRVWAISSKAVLLFVIYAGFSWRWPHTWLIVMTSLQFVDLLLVMAVVVDGSILISVNGLLRNVVGWLMLLTFAVGIVQTARANLMARVQPLPRCD